MKKAWWQEKYLVVCKYLHRKTVEEDKKQPVEETSFIVAIMQGDDPELKAQWMLYKFHCAGKIKNIVLHPI